MKLFEIRGISARPRVKVLRLKIRRFSKITLLVQVLLLTQIVRVCCGPYAKGAGRLADCRISLAVDDTGPAVGLFKLTIRLSTEGCPKWFSWFLTLAGSQNRQKSSILFFRELLSRTAYQYQAFLGQTTYFWAIFSSSDEVLTDFLNTIIVRLLGPVKSLYLCSFFTTTRDFERLS